MTKLEAYAILGLETSADAEESRIAMRRLAKIHHPDKVGGSGKLFIEIMDAYRLITNETYRMNIPRLSFGNPYTENVFQGKLLKVLRDEGALCWKIVGNVFQKIGIPDIYVAHRAWTGWLELKTENEELRPHQAAAILKLNDRGVNALVVRYRLRHGIVIEKVLEDKSTVPLMICKDWKKCFIPTLVGVKQQLV